MGGVLVHLRAEARRRWPAWLAVVVLIGVVGGLVLGSLAGARRTHTAYDRFVSDSEAWDVLVNPSEGVYSALDPEAVAALPQVESIGTLDGGAAVLLTDELAALGAGPLVLAARDEQVLIDFSRPRVVDGSLYDPSDPAQLMIEDVVAAAYGLSVGDVVDVGTASIEEMIEWEEAGAEGPPPLTPHPATVVGTVVNHDGLVVDEAFSSGHVYLTPAFAQAHAVEPFFYGMAVRLRNGAADVVAFREAVQALAPGEAVEFKTESAVAETVARGTMPHTIALLLFATVVGLAGFVVAGQAMSRQLVPLRSESAALGAMGVDRRMLRRAALLRVALLAVGGAAVAFVVAVSISPLFPLGVADRAEIDPGIAVDLVVLGPGTALLAAGLIAWSLVSVARIAHTGTPAARSRRAGWAERLATTASSPIATMGLRASVSPGPGRAAPARAAVAGLALAVAAVAATVTFGANIDHLVTTPSTYGWSWDALVNSPGEEWEVPGEVFVERAAQQSEVTGWSVLTVDQVAIAGQRIPAVGIDYGVGDVGPTVVAGRRPEAADEIVLGARTMDRLGIRIGDRVVAGVGDAERPFEVVGQAVFAGLGTYPGADRTELGKGALFTRDSLAEVGEGFGFPSIAIETAGEEQLQAALDGIIGDQLSAIEAEQIEVHRTPQRPADVQALARVRSTPVVIAAVLALLGGVAFAFVLVSGVRGRRREIALLKTFGFRRRDVVGTVAWQATATSLVAGVVGVALGAVAGRLAWSVLTDALGVADDSRLPVALLGLVAAVVVIANVIAVAPGLLAARTRPAATLRAE